MNFYTNNISNISIPSSSFGGTLPKKDKCFHLKKQAPLSLITNPNAVFVKTKIGEIATFYKEACLKINHNKKSSLVIQGLKPKPLIHSKHKTNIISEISINLNSTNNNKTHDIICPNHNTKNSLTYINKTYVTKNNKDKVKPSVTSLSKGKGVFHKKINSTFQINNKIPKVKNTVIPSTINSNSVRHSAKASFHKETESMAINSNKTMTYHSKQNTFKNNTALFENELLYSKPKTSNQSKPLKQHSKETLKDNNHSQSILNPRIKVKGLEIKTAYDTKNTHNNSSNNKLIQKSIISSTRVLPPAKSTIINQNTKQSTRTKTESNDLLSCNKSTNKNNYYSKPNNTKDKKVPPKRPSKLLKCPFKLNLLDIISENTKNGGIVSNVKSSTRRTKQNNNKSISSIQHVTHDTIESILDDKLNKKGTNNTTTYEEDNDFDDLNSIVRKINFQVKKDNIFSVDNNAIYDSFCKKFETRFENALNGNSNHYTSCTNVYKRVSNSGSTCDNSSKKFQVTKGMLHNKVEN